MPSVVTDKPCYHCGLPVAATMNITVTIDGESRDMCCYGCQAVAQSITDSGMSDFYRYRTETPAKPEEIAPDFLSQLHAYDNPKIQNKFLQKNLDQENGDIREVSLILEGIVCAACVWLNEKTLQALDGVIDTNINYATHRARVKWNNDKLQLSEILETISRIGYMAHPYNPEHQQFIIEKERKTHLKRLGVSAILGMQIMILAVAMYTGEWWGMEPGIMQVFRWTSLALCTPLLFFSSRLFFENAWRDFKNKRVGMDVPIALGIGVAFTASLYHTVIGQGAVYYDSVSMFTFFLLLARYYEMLARKRSIENTESILNSAPAVATKIIGSKQSVIPVAELKIGDSILVKPGENIAADGIISRGASGVNESLITGESYPVTKSPGDKVISGSTNIENAIVINVTHTGDNTVLASIHRLLEGAQLNKPKIAQLADRIAAKFVLAILFITSLVAIYWYAHGSSQWLEYAIATLVVTCPCALSLATPTALTAASGQLAKLGMLPISNNILETFAKATDFIFDKTGTLTSGKLSLVNIELLSDLDKGQCLQIAAALEAESEHPLAKAITSKKINDSISARNCRNTPGSGITGTIDNKKWCIGNLKFIEQNFPGNSIKELKPNNNDHITIVLASEEEIVATLSFTDTIRDEAQTLISLLKEQNTQTHLLTGDYKNIAIKVGNEIKIDNIAAECLPDEKLKYVHKLQEQNRIVVMTGDGINDAPVLAGANISIAMGSGSQLASMHADMILISNQVQHIASSFLLAKKTLTIIKQNMSWAIIYNFIAIPAAALGYVQPWLAATGMSISSLVVVLNALRLSK